MAEYGNEPEALEIYHVDSTYCDGIASVDLSPSGNARVTFYEEHRASFDTGVHRVIIARFVVPEACLMDMAGRLLSAARRGDEPKVVHLPIAGRAFHG